MVNRALSLLNIAAICLALPYPLTSFAWPAGYTSPMSAECRPKTAAQKAISAEFYQWVRPQS
jgi:hypothetical protein